MKKPIITIQYFIDRGRRRTVILSLKRLNILLVAVVAVCLWTVATTGYVFYHVATGQSPFQNSGAKVKPAMAVNPDQPQKIPPRSLGPEMKLAAKSQDPVPDSSSAQNVLTPDNVPPQASAVTVDAKPATDIPPYTLASLMEFEAALKKSRVQSGPLRFRNVRLSVHGDHLRVNVEIEKLTGHAVEGHCFVAAEYLGQDGRKWLITSHGKRDWETAIAPASFAAATYFKARMVTRKRFDIVHSASKSAKLISLKLVARDKNSGRTVVEEITPELQTDVLGF